MPGPAPRETVAEEAARWELKVAIDSRLKWEWERRRFMAALRDGRLVDPRITWSDFWPAFVCEQAMTRGKFALDLLGAKWPAEAPEPCEPRIYVR